MSKRHGVRHIVEHDCDVVDVVDPFHRYYSVKIATVPRRPTTYKCSTICRRWTITGQEAGDQVVGVVGCVATLEPEHHGGGQPVVAAAAFDVG